jgi:hypothetical protein
MGLISKRGSDVRRESNWVFIHRYCHGVYWECFILKGDDYGYWKFNIETD